MTFLVPLGEKKTPQLYREKKIRGPLKYLSTSTVCLWVSVTHSCFLADTSQTKEETIFWVVQHKRQNHSDVPVVSKTVMGVIM